MGAFFFPAKKSVLPNRDSSTLPKAARPGGFLKIFSCDHDFFL
jgi:hypothetical protein